MKFNNVEQENTPAVFSLCSAEYIRFMRAVGGIFQSDEELFAALTQEFPALAELLHIGYCTLHLEAPGNNIVPQGQHSIGVLAGCPEDAEMAHPFEMPFRSSEKGIFCVTAYQKRGYTWTETERDQIHFLAENIFILLGRARMTKLLTIATSTDPMTGVLSMAGIHRYAAQLAAMGRLAEFTGMFLNLKNYKFINNTVGHQLGDEIMIRYCRACEKVLAPDERMARPGGDNFVFLVHKENVAQMLSLLQELPITISLNEHPRTFLISAHIGLYDIQPGDSFNDVLNGASIALSVVSDAGYSGDSLWYVPGMQDRMMHEKQISQRFSQALKSGEFLVYYQPKVNLEDRTLCGCEALCRWFHDGELVPPMDFIPVLEKEGTVCDLDFYVFDRVCADLRDWLDRGIEPVRVSVNFSQQHLQDNKLADRIAAIMQKYHIESRYIEVELTEMSGAKNHDAMIDFLAVMRGKGICTSIDDFGTGYSSLNMLREFQMDIIKLDKSFLDRISIESPDFKADEVIVENIVRMAQSLNLEIISEGVETRRQADFLKSVKCNMAQGFLFDKPLPHDEFEKRLLHCRVYPTPDRSAT